jgi:hypothetical protein
VQKEILNYSLRKNAYQAENPDKPEYFTFEQYAQIQADVRRDVAERRAAAEAMQ